MRTLIFCLIVILTVSCEKEIFTPDLLFECSDNVKVCDLARANNNFGFTIFNSLHDKNMDENIFISPFSISTALTMTLNGAAGDTKTEMLSTLKYFNWDQDSLNAAYRDLLYLLPALDNKVKISNANSIWYRNGFNVLPEFLDVNNQYFNSEIKSKDFTKGSTLEEINNWVENRTEGKIKDILEKIDAASMMFLINAIYFKGQWMYEFDKKNTANTNFYLENGSSVNVEMMHENELTLPYFQNEKFSMLDLPYGDSVFSMSLILPNYNYKIDDVIRELNITKWEDVLNKMSNTTLDVKIPKFKLEYKKLLKPVLRDLGMLKAFEGGQADFSEINGSRNLYVDEVIHQSFVEVDEEGTEAAAATVVVVNLTSTGNSFNANRPFVFLIRDNRTGSILFIGKMMNPSE